MEKKEWKKREKKSGNVVWWREEGGEKSSGAQLFSLRVHQNSIFPE